MGHVNNVSVLDEVLQPNDGIFSPFKLLYTSLHIEKVNKNITLIICLRYMLWTFIAQQQMLRTLSVHL